MSAFSLTLPEWDTLVALPNVKLSHNFEADARDREFAATSSAPIATLIFNNVTSDGYNESPSISEGKSLTTCVDFIIHVEHSTSDVSKLAPHLLPTLEVT